MIQAIKINHYILLSFFISNFLIAKEKEWKPKYQKEYVKVKSSAIKKEEPKKVEVKNESIVTDEDNSKSKVYNDLIAKFKINYKNKKDIEKLKSQTISLKNKAVPVLVNVMKSSEFPEQNRWIATFLLGRIMGKKSSAYISKYCSHADFSLRLAALKTLLALKEDRYKGLYAKMLKDPSLIVRTQALEVISHLEIKKLAPYVWQMLYDKENYSGNNGKQKRGHIIKKIIETIGKLKFDKAKSPLLEMVKKDKYKDVFDEVDQSLALITGKNSPKGNLSVKRHFWNRYSMSNTTL